MLTCRLRKLPLGYFDTWKEWRATFTVGHARSEMVLRNAGKSSCPTIDDHDALPFRAAFPLFAAGLRKGVMFIRHVPCGDYTLSSESVEMSGASAGIVSGNQP